MKPRGRSPKELTATDVSMVEEYLNTDKSLIEVATKYKVSPEGLRYKVKKYRQKFMSDGVDDDKITKVITRRTITFLFTEDKSRVLLAKHDDGFNGITRLMCENDGDGKQYAAAAVKEQTGLNMEDAQNSTQGIANRLFWVMDASSEIDPYEVLHIYAGIIDGDYPAPDNLAWFDVCDVDALGPDGARFSTAVNQPLYIAMARSVLANEAAKQTD